MSKGIQVAGAALAAVVLAGVVLWMRVGPNPAPRPEGTGDVGVLAVYAQLPKGPVRLPVGRPVKLLRPQDFAFRFMAEGTGPRYLRVELEADGHRTVLHEVKHATPSDEYLDFVLRLDERHPDDVMLTVVVEAPHMMSAVSDFPIRLMGAERPFWETATSTPAAKK